MEAFLNAIVKFLRKGIFVKTTDIQRLEKNGIKSELRHGCNSLMIFLKGDHNFLLWVSSHSI